MNKTILFSMVMILLLVTSVVAAPGVPHQFYGSVTVNGKTAPDNLFIEAKIGTSTYSTVTKDGQYGFDPIFYVEDPNSNRQGSTIQFYIEGVPANQALFDNGRSTKLELSAQGVTIPVQETNTTNEVEQTQVDGNLNEDLNDFNDSLNDDVNATNTICEPDWVCSEWTDCSNNQQKRVCIDRNQCDSDDESTKPDEQRSCELTQEEIFGSAPDEEEDAPRTGFFGGLTSLVTGDGNISSSIIPLVALFIIIAGLFVFFFYKRKKN